MGLLNVTWLLAIKPLDAGLRPVEVERASINRVNIQNGMLRIPKEDSSKNRDKLVRWIDRTNSKRVEAVAQRARELQDVPWKRFFVMNTENVKLLPISVVQISSQTSL